MVARALIILIIEMYNNNDNNTSLGQLDEHQKCCFHKGKCCDYNNLYVLY